MIPKTIELTVPFPSPRALGYGGNRSKVAFWWEPGGDELACFDGQRLTVGMCDNYMFLQWIRDNHMFMMTDLQIGDSDNQAVNCILVDTKNDHISIVPKEETYIKLRDEFVGGYK